MAVANPDAMPVILRTPEEIEIWMTAPWEESKLLQRPLPPGMLKVVSVGPKEDRHKLLRSRRCFDNQGMNWTTADR